MNLQPGLGNVRFGVFEANLQSGELRKQGIKLRLPPQSFQVLAMLLEQPGELVTREEIRNRLWPADTFVDFDHSLNTAINKIRETLGDNAETPRFVETIPRRGYRFLAPVERPRPESNSASSRKASSARSSEERASNRWWLTATVVAALVLATAFLLKTRFASSPDPHVRNFKQITNDGADKMSVFSIGAVPPPIVTDGPRIYFNERLENENYTIAEVAASGGETVPIVTPLSNIAVVGISPDGADLLAYSFLAYESRVPLWVLPVLGGSPHRVGEFLAVDANWSRNGQIVYTSEHDIFTAKPDGTGIQKLATVEGRPVWPRWSPDGRVLRFTVYDPNTDSSSLWEVVSNGSNLHPLLPDWKNHAVECCGNWTPDGRYFLFQSSKNGRTDIWSLRESQHWWQASNREPVQLTAGPMSFSLALPSTDGTRLFALGTRLRGELLRYDFKSKQFVTWLGGISASGITFSPDRDWVAYTSFPEGILWKTNLDGSQRVQLTFSPMEVSAPRWSPDGRRIVFMGRQPGHAWRVFAVSSEGGTIPEEMIDETGIQAAPDWSPDGKAIVFSGLSEDVSGDATTTAIGLTRLDTHKTELLPSSKGLYCARWSPNGRYVSATASDGQRLMMFDLTTQEWTELAKVSTGCSTWSRDGEYLYFQTINVKNPAVYRVAIKNRAMERLFSTIRQADAQVPWWSDVAPDGSVFLLRDESSDEIYSLDCEFP